MVHYSLSIENPQRQFIQFRAEFPHDGTEFFALQLPAWRPGRYELANFAQHVRNFTVSDENGNALQFQKDTKDLWKINGTDQNKIIVQYEFYANILNAGSTFLDENLLYINPVNCFMYEPGKEEVTSFQVSLNTPEDYILASPLADKLAKSFVAKNVHELMDSPFMTSVDLKHHQFEESGCNFHIWVNGKMPLDFEKIEADFRPFCNAQIRDFKTIPVDEYLFLFHFLEENSYHGVEHEKCTVITLGPSEKLLDPVFYEELLGVSSHELYHTWNVKAMRPLQMLPYNYAKENYSELGFVYEGVTTYMGDWYLLSSGVFDFKTYAKHIGSYLNRHFHNYGRLNYSVAESSHDTWIDGYKAGAPGRKVSIYTEGCLIAFISDLKIIRSTGGAKNLASVMEQMWQNFGLKGIGYTADDYIKALESVSGESFQEIRDELIYGKSDFRPFLEAELSHFGMELVFSKNPSSLVNSLGIKAIKNSKDSLKIVDIEPNSPADTPGIHIGDLILGFGEKPEAEISTQVKNLDISSTVKIHLSHIGVKNTLSLTPSTVNCFSKVSLCQSETTTDSQADLFKHWFGDK